MRTVYLAGPIGGCTKGEANDWRDRFAAECASFGIKAISPLRCEPIVGKRYKLSYNHIHGTPSAITAKNFFDVQNCDMTVAYLPTELVSRRPSHGTICEIAWAFAARKPVVLVTDDALLRDHPVINMQCGWKLNTLDDALEVVTGILGQYAERIAS